MSDDDSIPVDKGESREAFLRYLPKRIVSFEQRMQRYRREGWDHAGMTVLKGDLLRVADASSHYQVLETCRHLLVLARLVGEHVANKTAPDPQQAFRMFAQLSAVAESLPAVGQSQDESGTGKTTPVGWQVEASTAPPVAEANAPTEVSVTDADEPVAPVGLAEPIEWVLAEPSADFKPIDSAAPIEPDEPVELAAPIEWALAEPSAQVEPIGAAAPAEPDEPIAQQLPEPSEAAEAIRSDAPIEPTEPVARPLAERSMDVQAVETAVPMEQAIPSPAIEPLAPVERVEPIAHVDPVETGVSPTQVEAAELPVSAQPSAEAGMDAPVESLEAVDSVELREPNELDEPDEPDTGSEAGVRRVFYLNDGNAFATELGQRLESEGYAIEPVESVDELSEMMMCLMPQMLLVDASHMSDLDAIDKIRRDTQQRSETQRHIQLVALAAQDNLEGRRAAHRAEVDVLLFPPFDIADVVGRLHDLDAATEEQQVRVLVVDDERTDALFALTVLNRAGMRAHVEINPKRVLESIKALHPDLVLMDLHMPFVNGVELTMLIREDPVFARLPIVFLSGESDPDSRLEAINAGGDDFLFKPIRPRHLVAAVKERMRRLHPINKQGLAAGASDDPSDLQRLG